MANKITVLLDLVTDKAQASAKGFRASIAEAEGATNKFKAGATSAFTSIQANAGILAATAGTALLAFGAKAVQASQETALAAGKLADATGLTVEAASRLNEVGADLGISGETITSVVKKMTVEIGKGNPLLDEYGIALQRTDEGAADLNATLIDTIRRIGQIEDPTKRAAAAQAAFGRGYAEAAELIFSNADQLQEKLDAVSKAKVITPEELQRAREFRDAMEELKDVGEDLTVAIGQSAVPALTDLAEVLVDVNDVVGKVNDGLGDLPGNLSLGDINKGKLGAIGLFVQAARDVKDALDDGGDAAEDFAEKVDRGADAASTGAVAVGELGEAAAELGPRWSAASIPLEGASGAMAEMRSQADVAADAVDDLGDSADDAADKMDPLTKAVQDVRDAIDDAFGGLEDDLDLLDLFDNIQEQFEKIAEAAKEANDPAGIRDFNREVRTLQEQLLDMVRTRDDLSAKEQIEFVARIRQGDIDELHRVLDDLTKDQFVNIIPVAPQHDAFHSLNASLNPATGTATPIFNQPSGPSSSSIINQTIIYPVGSTPTLTYQNQIIDDRRNGAR